MEQKTDKTSMHQTVLTIGTLMLLLSTAGIVSSCEASQNIILNRDGSGSFSLSLKLTPELSEYLLDIGEAAGYYEDRDSAAIFDIEAIKQTIREQKGLNLVSCTSKTRNSLDLTVSFANLNTVITSQNFFKKSGMITFSETGQGTNLNLRFDQRIFEMFLEEMNMFSKEDYEYFLPQKGETKESYYENLDFSLENGSLLLKKSIVTVAISVPGTIIKHNGTIIRKNTVRYSIPLEYILFPDSPRIFYIQYK